MKKEYDFSKAEQGKFYRAADTIEIPVYPDKEVKEFFSRRALAKNAKLGKVINIDTTPMRIGKAWSCA